MFSSRCISMLITLQLFHCLPFPAFIPLSHLLLYFYSERYLVGAEQTLAGFQIVHYIFINLFCVHVKTWRTPSTQWVLGIENSPSTVEAVTFTKPMTKPSLGLWFVFFWCSGTESLLIGCFYLCDFFRKMSFDIDGAFRLSVGWLFRLL